MCQQLIGAVASDALLHLYLLLLLPGTAECLIYSPGSANVPPKLIHSSLSPHKSAIKQHLNQFNYFAQLIHFHRAWIVQLYLPGGAYLHPSNIWFFGLPEFTDTHTHTHR